MTNLVTTSVKSARDRVGTSARATRRRVASWAERVQTGIGRLRRR